MYESSSSYSRVVLKQGIDKPKVYFRRDALEKIKYFVDKCSVECSGFGTVEKHKGYYIVTDVMLLPQRNGATSTEIDAEDMNRALYTLRNAPGELNFWWHSHVNMGVFWSGTDDATIKQIGEQGWCLATVFNKKNEMRSAVFIKNAIPDPVFAQDLFLDELENHILANKPSQEILNAWDAEYKKNITDVEEKERAAKKNYPASRHWDGAFSGNSLGGTGNWKDEQFDFGAVNRSLDDGAPSRFDRKERVGLTGWLAEFETEIENPPNGWSRHDFVKYLKVHKNILTMEKVAKGGEFEYLGWGIENDEHLEWAKQCILLGDFTHAEGAKQ